MATEKDLQFVQFIFEQTQQDKIHWEATAETDEFVVTFKGKYKVFVDSDLDRDGSRVYQLRLTDDSDRELLTVTSGESGGLVRELYRLAQRNSLNVDKAIDEIMASPDSPIKDEDIPF